MSAPTTKLLKLLRKLHNFNILFCLENESEAEDNDSDTGTNYTCDTEGTEDSTLNEGNNSVFFLIYLANSVIYY